MKLFVKNQNTAETAGRQIGGTQTSYEVPNQTITWAAVLYLFLTIAGNTISGLVTNQPDNKKNKELILLTKEHSKNSLSLVEQDRKVQLLNAVLSLDSNKDRKASLLLLIKANVISDNAEDELYSYVGSCEYIPQWPYDSMMNNELSVVFINSTIGLPAGTIQRNAGQQRLNNNQAETVKRP